VYKKLTGMKSNQPAYFDKLTRKMIEREFLESFVDNDDVGTALNPILSYLRSAFIHLENCAIDELSYSQKASMITKMMAFNNRYTRTSYRIAEVI
jgi:hypothetical protein